MLLAIYAHLFSVFILLAQIVAVSGTVLMSNSWRNRVRSRLLGLVVSVGLIGVGCVFLVPAILGGDKTGWLPVPQWHDFYHLFDTISRKQMITATYGIAGVLLALTGWLFHAGMLTAQTQTIAWMIIFFVASAAASSAYLTVSEIFPLEIRALAIAIFYAFGTLAGGAGAPILFGRIIGTGSKTALLAGYLVGAALMIIGALVEAWLGVDAERKSLEHVATPLSCKL